MDDSKREYSEIEIQTAKNLIANGYEWIARDKNGLLCTYDGKPKKLESCWRSGKWQEFASFVPIFPQIRWNDEEPVRLRDIVQILTDEEREWLKVVVRPFRDRLKAVEAYDGAYYGRYIQLYIAPPEGWKDRPDECNLIQLSRDSFAGMEDHKEYTPEELGL